MYRILLRKYYQYFTPYQLVNLSTTSIIPRGIVKKGLIKHLEQPRLLEIGPRWGIDARDWDKRISMSEMVLLDLPAIKPAITLWIDELKTNNKVYYHNIMRLSKEQTTALGTYDIVYCSGVLYHIAEQFRFLKILFDLLNEDGILILGTWVSLSKKNDVIIHWPKTNDKFLCHHEPSRLAVSSWLEMVGFTDVNVHDDIYPKQYKNRTVFTAKKVSGAFTPSYFSLDERADLPSFGSDGKLEVVGTQEKFIEPHYLP